MSETAANRMSRAAGSSVVGQPGGVLGELPHGRVERGRAPAGVEEDPTEIDRIAVAPVPSGMEVGQSVDRVGREEAHRADGQETARGVPEPAGAPQVGQHGQQKHVAERIGGGGQPDQQVFRTRARWGRSGRSTTPARRPTSLSRRR